MAEKMLSTALRSVLILLVFCLEILPAAQVTLDFESLADGETLTTQVPGLTFSNAIVLSAGISLNEFEFPPRSGSNVVSDDGGPVTIDFSSPVISFAGYFSYLLPLTLTAFDASNAEVASATSLFGNNMALSGDPGSSPNEFLQVAFAGGISSIAISGDPFGGSFTMDDASFEAAAIPEPGTFCMLSSSLVLMAISVFRLKL